MFRRCLLYYTTDRTTFAVDEPTRRKRLLEKVGEATTAGVNYIQLREKDLSTRDLESLAHEAVHTVREAGKRATENRQPATVLLINSRTDVALSVGAAGVHLRSDDISPQAVRKLWTECGAGAPARVSPQNPAIGISCHSPEEVGRAAAKGATFAVFGPVFEKGQSQPTGLVQLREACRANIPVLALGGVTIRNARACLQAGAAGIAAIRLFQENDIESVVRALRGS